MKKVRKEKTCWIILTEEEDMGIRYNPLMRAGVGDTYILVSDLQLIEKYSDFEDARDALIEATELLNMDLHLGKVKVLEYIYQIRNEKKRL